MNPAPNPYKYQGPLDPDQDRLVCVTRSDLVNRVIGGVIAGDYWGVLGPKCIGKTTFLYQIKREFSQACSVYIDFKRAPTGDAVKFYQWLVKAVLAEIPIPGKKTGLYNWKEYGPEMGFFEFLKTFAPSIKAKKILFLLDDIDGFPWIKDLLRLWRKVYHERSDHGSLEKYAVIVTCSRDLVAQSTGATSPFNIAEIMLLKDFSPEESETLIHRPMESLNLEISSQAKQGLIAQTAGHPQLLQHACHVLVARALSSGRLITEKSVTEAIDVLLTTNVNLALLEQDFERDGELSRLLQELLEGKQRKFFPHKEYFLAGAGPVVEHHSYCAIRNPLYERWIKNRLRKPGGKISLSLRVPSRTFTVKRKDSQTDD
jgi:hypothetical protein